MAIPSFQTGNRLTDPRSARLGIVVRVNKIPAIPHPIEEVDIIWSDATILRTRASWAQDYTLRPDLASADDINAAFAAVVDAQAADMAKRAQAATAQAAARVALLAQYPQLQLASSSTLSGPALAAANLRHQLKAAFPRVKFSVTSKRYSGGDSVDVRWTDGPCASEVEALADRYQAGTFDGSDDSYHYASGEAAVWCELFGGARFVFCERRYSDQAIAAALAEVLKTWGAPEGPAPTVEDWKQGRLYDTTPARHCDDLQCLVRQVLGASGSHQ